MDTKPSDPSSQNAGEPGAGQGLEVYFCDLCNSSVPVKDLEGGLAKRVKSRLIGSCCLKELTPKPVPAEARGSAVGVVLLLAAIAGATVFLDRRIGDEIAGVSAKIVAQVDAALTKQTERLANIEGRVTASAEKSDLGAVADKIADLQAKLVGVGEKADAANANASTMRSEIGKAQEAFSGAQKAQHDSVSRLEGALRVIADDLATLKALPRSAAPSGDSKPAANDGAMPVPADPGAGGLPRELLHHVATLTDSDAGVRFQAVAALVESKHPAVREPLLTMVKDPDMFVRRQVFEGLRMFRHATCVEALLVGLSDQVAIVAHTAHQSLLVLTNAKITFDPNGTKEQRSVGVRKWREWWDENKKAFGS